MFLFRSSKPRLSCGQKGNGESLQTANKGFVIVSHDIITDGASRGVCAESSLRLESVSNTYTNAGMTSSAPHSRFHLAAPFSQVNTLSAP